ncbi:FecR domain-containing protein [Halopseudomonas salina]|uniref:Iron uptake regulator n=1 Tax=Halopseudomonas salina TaxID=1323744 RepID=A0ABQ1P4P0_9GAMM|nr:FecR domain-containing protein [Halopseudomonas salina]GGC89019.1 iron uptake regulator [Halopseudomonas salina]
MTPPDSPSSAADYRPIAPAVAERAVELFLAWQDADQPGSCTIAIARWRNEHPEHERAWQQIERVNLRFQQVGTGSVGSAAQRALIDAGVPRRSVLKGMAMVLLLAGGGIYSQQERPWEAWTADYRTGMGERHRVILSDGTELTLNSETAVRVVPTTGELGIEILRGEILISTGSDRDTTNAELPGMQVRVTTDQGQITPIGTRFSVRQLADKTRVGVYRGRVRVQPFESGHGSLVESGQALMFNRHGALLTLAADETDAAWARGMIVARSMLLPAFLEELSRYHPGVIRSAPVLRNLKVSGTYPIAELNPVLDALAANLPLQIRRVGPLWTTLVPAPKSL